MIMHNKVYDILKWTAEILLPSVGTLYFALAQIWGWGYGEEIVGSITAIDAFLGAFVRYSKQKYKKEVTENEPENSD